MPFTLHDIIEGAKNAEIHLASAPHVEGGRVRITWRPWSQTFILAHTRDGATVSQEGAPKVDDLFPKFMTMVKPLPKR